MLLSDIKKKNDIILSRALLINNLLNKYNDLNKDIIDCNDAYLYYTVTSQLSTQQKAPLGEKFLCKKLGYKKVDASKDCGDAVDKNGYYYEFKNSFTNLKENLNIRQIRLWQDVDYYYCFYINENDLSKSIFFILTKEQMINEVEKCGGFTHGTISANKKNINHEYSITIPIYNDNNENTKRWKNNYLSIELKRKILGKE